MGLILPFLPALEGFNFCVLLPQNPTGSRAKRLFTYLPLKKEIVHTFSFISLLREAEVKEERDTGSHSRVSGWFPALIGE